MASPIAERAELLKLYSSRNWSKAIRVLDSLLSRSCSIQDLWFLLVCLHLVSIFGAFRNRASCYSQLELHKHAIKDCDRALDLDSAFLRAYILKGALGRRDDAFLVWKQGYQHALHQSADIKQLVELGELLANAKQNGNACHDDEQQIASENPTLDSSLSSVTTSVDIHSSSEPEICNGSEQSSDSDHAPENQSKQLPVSHLPKKPLNKVIENVKFSSVVDKLSDALVLHSKMEDTSDPQGHIAVPLNFRASHLTSFLKNLSGLRRSRGVISFVLLGFRRQSR